METTAERNVPPEREQGQTPERPQRRVGTFTLGLTLLAGGGVLLAATFFPALDLTWALRLGPLILICLGVETLLSTRKHGRIKYDWAGILLSFLLACGGLGLFAASWGLEQWTTYGYFYEGARMGNESALVLDYQIFNGVEQQELNLRAGDVLHGRVETRAGRISAYLMEDETGELLLEDTDVATGVFTVEIPRDGIYTVSVTGHRAAGSFCLKKSGAPDSAEPIEPMEPIEPAETPEETEAY